MKLPARIHSFLPALTLPMASQFGYAGSATWNLSPISGDWYTAANWTPATVPNGPGEGATFDFSRITNVNQPFSIQVAEIVFNSGASAFTISTAKTLTINGAGVTNNSGIEQNFVCLADSGEIHFRNSATAGGEITFTLQGTGFLNTKLVFHDAASAGSATVVNESGFGPGGTWFYDSSTAANGTFINQAGAGNGGATLFNDSSTAGNATLICESGPVQGFVNFFGRSSAGGATITVDGASPSGGSVGKLQFLGSSTAGSAMLTANGGTVRHGVGGQIAFWGDTTTADNATLIANAGTNGGLGGAILFVDGSLGGSARVQVFGNGTLDVSQHDPPGMSIGSIEGNGVVLLGANNFTVGTNDLNTTFAGTIRNGQNGSGGSLTKIGRSTLTFINPSSYTGNTVIQGPGMLFVNNKTGTGTGAGAVQVNRGGLGGRGTIAGSVTVGGVGEARPCAR